MKYISVNEHNLPDISKLMPRLSGIMDRKYFTNHGPLVNELDRRLAEYFGVKNAVAVTNGTIAAMCITSALSIKGEVILPAFAPPASALAVTWAGGTPVFCDVDPVTHMMTPEAIHNCITPSTDAIFGIHLWGCASNLDDIVSLASKNNLRLIYDATQAVCSSYKQRIVTTIGDATWISFHAENMLSAGEGGCILTDDDTLAGLVRTARNFHTTETFGAVYPRINGKMSEAQAALALTSLDELDSINAEYKLRYDLYLEKLEGVPSVDVFTRGTHENHTFQYTVIELHEDKTNISRDELIDSLKKNNIHPGKLYCPGLHRTTPFRNRYPIYEDALPVTDKLSRTIMQLPSGRSVSLNQVENICDLISKKLECDGSSN